MSAVERSADERHLRLGLGDLPVIRTSLQYIYNLAAGLDQLGQLRAGKLEDIAFKLIGAEQDIRQLLTESVYSASLRNSQNPGAELLDYLNSLVAGDWKREVLPWEIIGIQRRYADFKTVLVSELGVLPSYFVNQKGAYDTLTLLQGGTMLFPAKLLAKVPEAKFDALEAAKALAFEMGTAAGFHIYRCLEAVLRRYWSHVSNGHAPPKVRSVGVYVAALEKNKLGDPKVVAALRQIGLLPVSRTPSLGVLVGSEVDHGTKDNGTTDVQPGVQV